MNAKEQFVNNKMVIQILAFHISLMQFREYSAGIAVEDIIDISTEIADENLPLFVRENFEEMNTKQRNAFSKVIHGKIVKLLGLETVMDEEKPESKAA